MPEIEGKLRRILEADGRAAEPGAVTLIARLAAGGMRDAESMLDQLLGTSAETVTDAAVRELLGLADAAASMASSTPCSVATSPPGWASSIDSRNVGRDPRALLDQVVDALRARLVAMPSGPDGAAVADVARRLVAIDPDRAGHRRTAPPARARAVRRRRGAPFDRDAGATAGRRATGRRSGTAAVIDVRR